MNIQISSKDRGKRAELYRTEQVFSSHERRDTDLSRGFKFADLFCGIGGFHTAAKTLGGACVFACDINEDVRHAYESNYHISPKSDITDIDAAEIPDHDIMFAGFPCQPFSIIGQRRGFDDSRGTMFFEIMRMLKTKRPRMALFENVKQMSTHNNGDTIKTMIHQLEAEKYNVCVAVLNALDHGLPQRRERTFIACFRESKDLLRFEFPKKSNTYKPLDKILEKDVHERHYASNDIVTKRRSMHVSEHRPSIWHENKGGHISSYPYSCAIRAGASHNYLLVNGERRPTPRELLRLQGFPDNFRIVCSDGQTRRQAGNAVPVTVVKKILRCMLVASA